jgi:uncharacterized protein (TIGR02646 family)
MRAVTRGDTPLDGTGVEIIFDEYAEARRYLIDRLGEYCSYCERHIPTSLAVEHIKPKTHNPNLELCWDNLLLACTNCNSTKGHENIIVADYALPHIDNTYDLFQYDVSAIVKPKPGLSAIDLEKTAKTIDLVGLGEKPPAVDTKEWKRASDRRFEHRLKSYLDAERYSMEYSKKSLPARAEMLTCLETIVLATGFWSIWVNSFREFPEVVAQFRLIFVGTRY